MKHSEQRLAHNKCSINVRLAFWAKGLFPVVPALSRLRQEDFWELKDSLGYTVNSRSAWATE